MGCYVFKNRLQGQVKVKDVIVFIKTYQTHTGCEKKNVKRLCFEKLKSLCLGIHHVHREAKFECIYHWANLRRFNNQWYSHFHY